MTTIIEPLVWRAVSETSKDIINPLFRIVITDKEALSRLLSPVTFAPQILDALQSPSDQSPSLELYKGLPTTFKKRWAVYLLVLEKPGARFGIYIGTGTCSLYGVETRFKNYDSGCRVPELVTNALNDGYSITHRGLLCWAPIPEVGMYFFTRVLFVAVEATFANVLSAMANRTKLYGLPQLCPWINVSLDYDGLCTHTPFREGIPGVEDGLDAAQIAAKEEDMRLRTNRKMREYNAELRARDPKGYRARVRRYHLNSKPYSPTKKKASAKRKRQKSKASGKYSCVPCGVDFADSCQLNIHNNTAKHKNKVSGVTLHKSAQDLKNDLKRAQAKADDTYRCEPCGRSYVTQTTFDRHLLTDKHKNKVAAIVEVAVSELSADSEPDDDVDIYDSDGHVVLFNSDIDEDTSDDTSDDTSYTSSVHIEGLDAYMRYGFDDVQLPNASDFDMPMTDLPSTGVDGLAQLSAAESCDHAPSTASYSYSGATHLPLDDLQVYTPSDHSVATTDESADTSDFDERFHRHMGIKKTFLGLSEETMDRTLIALGLMEECIVDDGDGISDDEMDAEDGVQSSS